MANAPITPGSGLNVATIQVTRDGVTEHIQAYTAVDSVTFTPQNIDTNGRITVNQVGIGGAFTALPTATAIGSLLQQGATGLEFTLPPGTSVTYTIAAAAPTVAPTLIRTTSNPSTSLTSITDQVNLLTTASVYVTAFGGAPFYRVL